VHWPEPDAAPDNVKVSPGTGPPAADVTLTTMAIGIGQGYTTQSGWVWWPHPAQKHMRGTRRARPGFVSFIPLFDGAYFTKSYWNEISSLLASARPPVNRYKLQAATLDLLV
jgi:hypothetical protein